MNGYEHPLLTAYFAPEELAALRQLWAERQSYLDRLAKLPQTLCHLDAHRGNLNWQGDDLVLLDWAFVGAGALGEELAAFIGATLLLDYVPLAEAEQLEKVAFASSSRWLGSLLSVEVGRIKLLHDRFEKWSYSRHLVRAEGSHSGQRYNSYRN